MNPVFRYILLVYFITHIPITILVDLQGAFGHLYPDNLQRLDKWYTTEFNDFLMRDRPIWLQSILVGEAVFQLPFFFVAIYALLFKQNWIRIPLIIYSTHVATTLIPILGEFAMSKQLSESQRNTLVAMTVPIRTAQGRFAHGVALN